MRQYLSGCLDCGAEFDIAVQESATIGGEDSAVSCPDCGSKNVVLGPAHDD